MTRARQYLFTLVPTAAILLSGCATGPASFPVQATRFHYDPVATRGTVAVVAAPPDSAPGLIQDASAPAAAAEPGPEFRIYADAVAAALVAQGYTLAAPGARPDNLATVAYRQTTQPMPPRRSPVTVGIGGGGYSGGWSGGAGIGGGVSFPIGGRGMREGVLTEIQVRIRRGPDAIWEGNARSITDRAAPGGDAASIADRLARALFTGFPGESGRTIEVK